MLISHLSIVMMTMAMMTTMVAMTVCQISYSGSHIDEKYDIEGPVF